MSGSQLKKWVINISKYKLIDKETALLAKGLNFAKTLDKVPHDEYILATEVAGSEIIAEANKQVKAGASTEVLAKAQKRVDSIRSDIANILSKTRLTNDNIDK